MIQSCNNCVKIPFNKDDLNWINNLPELDDTLFFRGDNSTIDTFIITDKYRGFRDCNRFEVSKFQPEEFTLTGTCINSKVNGNTKRFFQFNLIKDGDTSFLREAIKNFKFYNLNTFQLKNLNDVSEKKLFLTCFQSQVNTYYFDRTKTNESSASYNVRILNFNWSKNHGLLKYMDSDSVSYEVWKRK